MESNQRVAILASSLALLVFVAAFMPWGVIRGQPAFQIGEMHFGGEPFVTGTYSMTATGWNGHLTLAGLSFPNWLVVLAAAAVAVLCWMRASNVWRAPGLLLFALAGYGLLHTGLTAFVMAKSSQACWRRQHHGPRSGRYGCVSPPGQQGYRLHLILSPCDESTCFSALAALRCSQPPCSSCGPGDPLRTMGRQAPLVERLWNGRARLPRLSW